MTAREDFDIEKESMKVAREFTITALHQEAANVIAESFRCCIFEEERKRVNEYAKASLLIDWINDPKRKEAIHAFTEGPERQVAYAIERLINGL